MTGNTPGMLAEDDELVAWKLERVTQAGAHPMGRSTYTEMAGFRPASTVRRGPDE